MVRMRADLAIAFSLIIACILVLGFWAVAFFIGDASHTNTPQPTPIVIVVTVEVSAPAPVIGQPLMATPHPTTPYWFVLPYGEPRG